MALNYVIGLLILTFSFKLKEQKNDVKNENNYYYWHFNEIQDA